MSTSGFNISDDLTQLYQRFVTWDLNDRLEVLGLILQALTERIIAKAGSFSEDDKKKVLRAEKARNLAAQAKTPDEQESAALGVIRLYEVVLKRFGHTLDITDFSARLVAERDSLAKQRAFYANRFSGCITGLNKIFEYIGVKFETDLRLGQTISARLDPTRPGMVFLSVDFLEDLLKGMANRGIFVTVCVEVFPVALKASAITPAGELDVEKLFQNLDQGMVALMAFLFQATPQSDPDRPQDQKIVAAPVRPPDRKMDSPIRYDNQWFKGSTALVYNILGMIAGRDITIAELRAESKLQISMDDLRDILEVIEGKGDQTGYWNLVQYASGTISFEWN